MALHLWWVEHHAYIDLALAPDAASAVAVVREQSHSYGLEAEYQASDAGPVDVARFVMNVE